jgi:drug/metabolite transporter (DMT)-like permease
MTRRGWLLFAVMGLIWGIPYLLIRVAVRDLSPPVLVFGRTLPAALVLLPLALRRGGLRPLLPRWPWLLLFAAVEMAGPWFLLARAEQRLSSSTTGLLIATVPLIGSVLARLGHHGERLGATRLAGLLLGLAGVAAVVGVDIGGSDPAAVVEVFGVALGYAIGPFVVSQRLSDLPDLSVVAVALGLTAVGYAPVALTQLPARVSGETVAAMVGLTLVCTALAFVLFFALIREAGPVRATVITYVNPAVAVVLGVLLLNEPFTAGIAVGFPLILVGSVLATRPQPSPTRSEVPSGAI